MLNKPRLPGKKPDNPHREDVNQRTMDMIAETRDISTSPESLGFSVDPSDAPPPDPTPTGSPPEASSRPRRSRNKPSPITSKVSTPIARILLSVPLDAETTALFERIVASAPFSQQSAMRRRIIVRAAAEFIGDAASLPPVRGLHSGQLKAIVRVPDDLVSTIFHRDDPKRFRPTSEVIGNAFAPYLTKLLRDG